MLNTYNVEQKQPVKNQHGYSRTLRSKAFFFIYQLSTANKINPIYCGRRPKAAVLCSPCILPSLYNPTPESYAVHLKSYPPLEKYCPWNCGQSLLLVYRIFRALTFGGFCLTGKWVFSILPYQGKIQKATSALTILHTRCHPPDHLFFFYLTSLKSSTQEIGVLPCSLFLTGGGK